MPGSIPHEEQTRLAELTRCGLLDTAPEPLYDHVIQLAARIYQVPMAVVSLVDRDRQWFKARHGIDLQETPRGDALCAWTIGEDRALVIHDAAADVRFADHPIVTGPPFLRFYAGIPLRVPSGHRIGALAVMDTAPRPDFGERELTILEDLARLVTDEIALRSNRARSQSEHDRRKQADQLRLAEANYRGIFENALEGICQTLPDGTLLSANPALARLLGYPNPQSLIEAVGSFARLYVDAARRAEFLRRIQATHIVTGFESEVWRADGSRVWISENVRAIYDADGALLHYDGTIEDISARRAAEQSLHQAREELEDRVRERTAELALLNGNLRLLLDERAVTDAAVRRSEAKFRAMIENAQDLISILDLEGTMIYQSPSVEHIFGFRPEELVGQSVFDYLHPDDHAMIAEGMQRILTHGETYVRTEARLRHRDGSWRLIESIGSRTPPESPIAGLVVNSRDISERRCHEEALRVVEARYQRIVANTPGMVFQFLIRPDRSVSMLFVSEECRRIYGMEPQRLYDHPNLFWEMAYPDDQRRMVETGRVAQANLEPYDWEGRVMLPTGETITVSLRCRPERLANGDTIWDGVVVDVSELKRAEAAMQAAKEEAERANNAKSEFLSRISHELRTPLNAILGFGQLLEVEHLSLAQRASVEQILRGGRHLLDLVNQVLDIVSVGNGSLEFKLEPVPVSEVVAEATALVRALAEKRSVGFDPLPPGRFCGEVLADRARLTQVLVNLLTNAINFNKEGGNVSFSCRQVADGRVRLSVSDTGPGLSREEAARVFTAFDRLSSPRRGTEGAGIGLAISRSLIEAMGGAIGVNSRPGLGATFFVDLPTPGDGAPVVPLPAPPAAAKRAEGAAFTRLRTLLHIESQRTNRELVERILAARPHVRLLESMDGESGVMRARIGRPDLILLDLQLTDLNSVEVLRRLRADPITARIPVVALGVEAAPPELEALRELGVEHYLTKPLNLARFLHIIDVTLARHRD